MINIFFRNTCINMSNKKITEFFSPTIGQKRKLNTKENDAPPDPCKKANNETGDESNVRNTIINIAKSNPALSANIGLTWFKALSSEFSKEYYKQLGEFLKSERQKYRIYPPEKEVYFWTNAVKIQDVKVILLGQDPYHGPKQAHGLAFSVRRGITVPPSLQNIFKELSDDIPEFKMPDHGFLYGWALQGVLLLNTNLTVRAGNANSHEGRWSQFTDAVIKWINANLHNSVFMLWGKNAQEKLSLISKSKHLVLTAPHPSPFSARRGFFGCRHFSKANEYLKEHNKKPIDWNFLPVSESD